MKMNQILGKTWYFDGKGADLPFYRLNEHAVILLDGGCPGVDEQAVKRLIDDQGLHVEAVLCTHAHPDHMALCRHYQARGAKIIMPIFEANCVASAENLKAWYPLFSLEQIRDLFSFMLLEADETIARSQTQIEICGERFEIIPTPGHTPEHIAVRTPDEVLYLADALMGKLECERAKLPYAFSIATDFETRARLRGEGAERYLMAHYGVERDISELLGLNSQIYLEVADKVRGLLTKPFTMEEWLAAVVRSFGFRSASTEYGLRLLERNLRSFVDYLMDIGEVKQQAIDGRMVYLPVY